jgi:hypothetical protein
MEVITFLFEIIIHISCVGHHPHQIDFNNDKEIVSPEFTKSSFFFLILFPLSLWTNNFFIPDSFCVFPGYTNNSKQFFIFLLYVF